MKILHVSEPVYPVVHGGLATHTHEMAHRQATQGHDVTVLGTTDGSTSVGHDEFEHRLILKDEWFRVFGARVAPGALYWLYRHVDEYDVVHTHSHLYFTSNLASLLNHVDTVPPVVVTNHATYANLPPVVSRLQFALLGIPTYRWADAVVCYNGIDEAMLQTAGVENIEIVPNGIDTDQFSPAEDRDVTSGPIIWSGRMTHRKGLIPVVKAMKHVVEDHPDLKLHLYGDGEQREVAERIVADAGIRSNVVFKGYVDQEVLLDRLKHARLYVAPTEEYTFGRGIMEAISCGIPTFSTNLPSDEELGDAGVPITRDPEEIAATIGQYLDDAEKLDAIAERGREIMTQKHDFRNHIDRVTMFYQSVSDQ